MEDEIPGPTRANRNLQPRKPDYDHRWLSSIAKHIRRWVQMAHRIPACERYPRCCTNFCDTTPVHSPRPSTNILSGIHVSPYVYPFRSPPGYPLPSPIVRLPVQLTLADICPTFHEIQSLGPNCRTREERVSLPACGRIFISLRKFRKPFGSER